MSDSNARARFGAVGLANRADRPLRQSSMKVAEGRGFEPLRPGSQDISVLATLVRSQCDLGPGPVPMFVTPAALPTFHDRGQGGWI